MLGSFLKSNIFSDLIVINHLHFTQCASVNMFFNLWQTPEAKPSLLYANDLWWISMRGVSKPTTLSVIQHSHGKWLSDLG